MSVCATTTEEISVRFGSTIFEVLVGQFRTLLTWGPDWCPLTEDDWDGLGLSDRKDGVVTPDPKSSWYSFRFTTSVP